MDFTVVSRSATLTTYFAFANFLNTKASRPCMLHHDPIHGRIVCGSGRLRCCERRRAIYCGASGSPKRRPRAAELARSPLGLHLPMGKHPEKTHGRIEVVPAS